MRFEDETELEKRTFFVELGCYKLYDTSSGPPLRLRGRLLLLPLQGRILFSKTYTHTTTTQWESRIRESCYSPLFFFLLRLSLSPPSGSLPSVHYGFYSIRRDGCKKIDEFHSKWDDDSPALTPSVVYTCGGGKKAKCVCVYTHKLPGFFSLFLYRSWNQVFLDAGQAAAAHPHPLFDVHTHTRSSWLFWQNLLLIIRRKKKETRATIPSFIYFFLFVSSPPFRLFVVGIRMMLIHHPDRRDGRRWRLLQRPF